ncbi:hypothetical protein J6590_041559 [Homalodisca vitripennis]|nr:hypothetical protein J6590_041559 [Homalodisca vitripennis]
MRGSAVEERGRLVHRASRRQPRPAHNVIRRLNRRMHYITDGTDIKKRDGLSCHMLAGGRTTGRWVGRGGGA